jgi:hypothetical protein
MPRASDAHSVQQGTKATVHQPTRRVAETSYEDMCRRDRMISPPANDIGMTGVRGQR